MSETVLSSVGAPQGTVLGPFLFTPYASDFQRCCKSCHVHEYSDDTAVIACISRDAEGEYRELVWAFGLWSVKNHLLLNTAKTEEMVIDPPPPTARQHRWCWWCLATRTWVSTWMTSEVTSGCEYTHWDVNVCATAVCKREYMF